MPNNSDLAFWEVFGSENLGFAVWRIFGTFVTSFGGKYSSLAVTIKNVRYFGSFWPKCHFTTCKK